MLNTLCGEVDADDFFCGSTVQKTKLSRNTSDMTCMKERTHKKTLKYTPMDYQTHEKFMNDVLYHHHTYHKNEVKDTKDSHFQSILGFYRWFLAKSDSSLDLR